MVDTVAREQDFDTIVLFRRRQSLDGKDALTGFSIERAKP